MVRALAPEGMLQGLASTSDDEFGKKQDGKR
jgi:hypothetical protein